MKALNIYLCGVGGQGIGLLAEVLIRACLAAGHRVKGVDTHGLAQRGGSVVSHLRLGEHVHSPLVPPGEADLVIGLERLEAYRATAEMLKDEGAVIFYDVAYQPVHVRLKKAAYPSVEEFEALVRSKHGRFEHVFTDDLPNARMQNVALLARIGKLEWIPGVDGQCMETSLREVLPSRVADDNIRVFKRMSR